MCFTASLASLSKAIVKEILWERCCGCSGIADAIWQFTFNASIQSPIHPFTHSFIPDIYIAPLQETDSEALSVQLRSKRNVLRSLQKEDMLFWGSKRSERGSSFHSSIHSLIRPFTHSFTIHSSVHLFIHSSVCLFIHSFIHSSIHSSIHLSIHSFVHPSIHSFF